MKVTQVLYGRNIGRMIKFHWFIQGKVKVSPTPTEKILKAHGYNVTDIKEILYPPKEKEKIEFIGTFKKKLPMDKNHPDYKFEPCYIYKDEDLLLEGLQQAKTLTNTVEIKNGLPDCLIEIEKNMLLPNEIHSEIKKRVMLSCMFDATQEKLPKIKDISKPAFNFKREYGITEARKNELLCKNLLSVCEQMGKNLHKSVVMNAFYSVPFNAHNKKIQFELKSELAVTSSKKLPAMADPSLTHTINLPDLHPLDCTISLKAYHFYTMQHIYPFNVKSKWPFVQAAIVHCNRTEVKNIFGEEVTDSQIQARSLLKGFTIAASEAKAMYGSDVKTLPEPMIVPVVQTDGQLFDFTIFQLNTLELDQGSKVKNIFWKSPSLYLYSTCKYIRGRPVLKEYNPEVIKKLITFYNID